MNAIEKKHEEICMQDYDDTQPSDHATITKDTAVGFAEWMRGRTTGVGKNNDGEVCYVYYLDSIAYTTSELYDIYVKSLEG